MLTYQRKLDYCQNKPSLILKYALLLYLDKEYLGQYSIIQESFTLLYINITYTTMFNEINPQNELGYGLFDYSSERKNEEDPLALQNQSDVKTGLKGRPKGEKNRKSAERKKKGGQKILNKKTGHWTLEENKKYHWFLEVYSKHFLQKHLRRSDKIFKTMEIFLGTREAEQCRSHHQKMQKKYKTFEEILLNLRHQYFGTDDCAPVISELEKNQIPFPDGIVSSDILYLKSQKQEEGKISNLGVEDHDEVKPFMNFYEHVRKGENIMSDQYQNQMNLKFLF